MTSYITITDYHTSATCHMSWLHNHVLQKDIKCFRTMILYYMPIACSTHTCLLE